MVRAVAGVARAIVLDVQPLGLERPFQLGAHLGGDRSHVFALSMLECAPYGHILRMMSGAFQYRPKFVDIRVRPPREGEEDVHALKPGERRCQHPDCLAVATAKAPKS